MASSHAADPASHTDKRDSNCKGCEECREFGCFCKMQLYFASAGRDVAQKLQKLRRQTRKVAMVGRHSKLLESPSCRHWRCPLCSIGQSLHMPSLLRTFSGYRILTQKRKQDFEC